jgi:hypothetical protein
MMVLAVHLNYLVKDYPKDKVFVWWGFSSCTPSIDVLQSDLFLGKNGRDIRQHLYFDKENEVLLLPATQFQIAADLR